MATSGMRITWAIINSRRFEAMRPRVTAGQIVHATALAIETDAKSRAPVDTGTLRRSIHTEQVSDLTARVGPSVDYAIHVEYGTARMHAQPYLTPAVEAARPRFAAAMAKLLS